MLPMSAYVVAYVRLLPKMRGAYVPMCFSGFLPPGGLDTAKTGHLAKMGQNDAKSAKCVLPFLPATPARGYAACV